MVMLALFAAVAAQSMPARHTPNLRELVETVDLSSVAISPDGRYVVYRRDQPSIADNSVASTWRVAASDGQTRPVVISDGGKPIVADNGTLDSDTPIWSADSRHIFFRKLDQSGVQLWRASRDGSDVRRMTDLPGDVDAFARTDDGRVIVRSGAPRAAIEAAEQAEYDSGILFDASIDPGQAVFRGGLINGRRASQRFTGDWFDRRGLLGDWRPSYTAIAVGADHAEPARPSDVVAFDRAIGLRGVLGFGPTSVSDPADSARAELIAGHIQSVLVTFISTGRKATCPDDLCAAGMLGATWIPGQRLAITRMTADKLTQVTIWTPADGKTQTLVKADELFAGDWRPTVPCAYSSRQAICVVASAGAPPRLEAIDLQSGRRSVLDEPSAGIGARFERISWADGQGRRFFGQWLGPRTRSKNGRSPLFITYTGCSGYLRGGTGDEWPLAVLAEQGIASLCITSGRSDTAVTYDAVSAYEVALDGVQSAIDTLDRRGLIDRTRVGMGGLSFGTEATAWVTTHSRLLATASLSSVLMEPAYYWFNIARSEDKRNKLRQWWKLGAPDETPERWRQTSIALNAGSIRSPLLFQIPEQEYRYNLELLGRLATMGKPVETIIFPDEAHVKFQPKHKLAVYQRNLDWFRFWLLDECRADAPSGQCERWSKLREQRDHAAALATP